jgi:acyl-CoA synthetase (AMP-forming)/AMP-acid ligase II
MRRVRTLPQMLADAALSDAGITFAVGGREVRRSYAELSERAHRIGGALRDAGFHRGDLIALVLPDAEEFLTALFGASIGGFVPASIYPPAPTANFTQYFDVTASSLRASGARGVITSVALAPGFDALRGQCPGLALVFVHGQLDGSPIAQREMRPPSLDDLAFVQFTSGSTAAPKGVALSHSNIAANVEAVNGRDGLDTGKDDVAVTWLPLYHDMGLVGMTFGAIHASRPAVIMTPQGFVKRPSDWLRAISRHRGTISFAPSFGYDLCVRRLRERDLEGLDLSSWRVAGCGAEPIHAATLESFVRKFAPVGFSPASLLPSYGLAEHVVAATFAPRGRPPVVERIAADAAVVGGEAALQANGDAPVIEVVSCGRPFPGHDIRIVDHAGRTVPERHVGEIVLGGPSVMLGYYKQEALTAEAIRDGWLHTGDLGYLSGGELFVCGRAKDVIIVNGRKYHPQDLEWAVDSIPGVRRGRVVAFGVSEPGLPDRIVIVVESKGTVAGGALTDAIRRRIGDLFGVYVDAVRFVPAGTVGRTTSGKIQRAATKARYQRGDLIGV